TAPDAFRKLKGAPGTGGFDGFFESRGPLPEALIAEAKGEHEGSVGSAGPPLTAALRLTRVYLYLARCDDRPDSRECARARQLDDLLDATGPLLMRRRIEELHTTPCATLKADVLLAWLKGLPVASKTDRESMLAELGQAVRSKLFLCYLADRDGEAGYRAYVQKRLPAPAALDERMLPVADAVLRLEVDGDALDRCGRAVRVLERLPAATSCQAPGPDALTTLQTWATGPLPPTVPAELELCQRVAGLLWSGAAISFPETPGEAVRVDEEASATTVAQLRQACDERRGVGRAFEESLAALAVIGAAQGDVPARSPWRWDVKSALPAESVKLQASIEYGGWVQHVIEGESACEALGLDAARCAACDDADPNTAYDCEAVRQVKDAWFRYRVLTRTAAFGGFAVCLALLWALRQSRQRRAVAGPLSLARESLGALGLGATPDGWRYVFPSRHDTLHLELPRTPSWERWGARACAVFSAGAPALREADVNHAAAVAQRESVRVVFLLHPDSAVPDLGAVRAILDWAARGGTRAVQVLPLALSRLAWARRDEDLLDLVEAATLRGNPFEVRGPVRSSSQFWNRERLVAGLLTESRNGNWVVVTGLRRFGKSSLALEVARRTTGPSAYVDLAGFHHEVSFGESPAVAVDAILRTLMMRLADSTAARFPAAVVPALPGGSIDAPTLAAWLRSLGVACGTSAGLPPQPMFLVLDETEQLLSQPPEKLHRALDVLATLVGRLRSAVAEPSSPHAGSTVGVVFCAALHPLLWAPLATLGGQSLMGAFPSICVPALDDEAARSMMQGLGAQQGIRFEDDALSAMVRASQGVPLLLRRLGTSVLELYDADRARQGSLGATRIGIEGATEAIRREGRGGSPLRVWVESEIAAPDGSPGIMLRALARADRVPVGTLQKLVEMQVLERFASTGLDNHLTPNELKRRAQEAASVMVRLLAESRLIETQGDLTSPDSYSLPHGVLRSILAEEPRS
ncbi:MAG: ATP-binding protein, partial [Myxococcaceae bacterium]|nr:ATP-binding protein [Myxococcaceae bacterium]